MAVQICETKFNPVDDSVLIWGSFNSWTFGIPMESVSDSLYAISFNLIIDSTYQFKFVNTHGNGVFWEEGPNRELLVPVGGTTFSDYFNRDSICNYPPVPVTFECNMAVQICEMNFDPLIDSLFLKGEFNSWSEDNRMLPISDTIWEASIDLEPGLYYPFKFYTSHNGGVWEFGDSRVIYVPLSGTSFYDYFNHDTICNPIPVEITSFTAHSDNMKIILNWSTATETNNKGFEIEKKTVKMQSQVINQWQNIGFIPGNGTTTEHHSYIYTDENSNVGKYQYRLKQLDYNGSYNYSTVIEIDVSEPKEFSLYQNYPNPFNPITTIKYSIGDVGTSPASPSGGFMKFVKLKVFDILGNEVATLVNEEQPVGNYTVRFDGSKLASGIYLYQLKSENFTQTHKMILLK